MNDDDILAAYQARRKHYDTYLQANDIHLHTCPGCGFPTLVNRSVFEICIVCSWEDDGLDDNADSILEELLNIGIIIPSPNGRLSLKENRINIGRILETNAELVDGGIDFDSARVLQTITFYQQRRREISDRMTGDEDPHDHIWMEWQEVKKDLQMALVVTKQ